MTLPNPIERFFHVDLSGFDPAATVRDEGATHRGQAEILAWWRDTKARYDHTATPEALDGTTVTASVSGNFPGSPVRLRFAFTLRDDRITGLEIA